MSVAAQTHNLKTIQWSVNVKIWDGDLFYELQSKGILVTYKRICKNILSVKHILHLNVLLPQSYF